MNRSKAKDIIFLPPVLENPLLKFFLSYINLVWILYLKVISQIFMHRIYSPKNLRCLVGILENAKCILGRMHFANSHFYRAEVRIQNILDSDSSFYF